MTDCSDVIAPGTGSKERAASRHQYCYRAFGRRTPINSDRKRRLMMSPGPRYRTKPFDWVSATMMSSDSTANHSKSLENFQGISSLEGCQLIIFCRSFTTKIITFLKSHILYSYLVFPIHHKQGRGFEGGEAAPLMVKLCNA